MKNINWFNKEIKDVEKDLQTNVETGLNDEQVKQRQERYGLNALKAKKKIKDKLEKQGYHIPKSVVPTKEVVAFFDIDIPYLESRVSSKKLIKNM